MGDFKEFLDPSDGDGFDDIDDDDPDHREECPVCGAPRGWESCWQCFGEGGFHDCGEDCCPCLYPEDDLNETCDACEGVGGYWSCPNAGRHGQAGQPHDRP